ncbi:sugar-binding domain-containing protein [Vallitaleaceae bacterium 9-2]
MFPKMTLLYKIIPKEMDILKRRYYMLATIYSVQPIGRRMIAAKLNIGEKIVRSDIEFFRKEGYVNVSTSGMILTEAGINLLDQLKELMNELEGIKRLQEQLKTVFGSTDIHVVSGNSDEDPQALGNIGRSAAKLLQSLITNTSVVAITGGHTMKSVVKYIQPNNQSLEEMFVVPARGSLGNNVETQANTLVEEMAKKIGCHYKLLNLPDNLSEKAIISVSKDPKISQVIEQIKKANIIVFGIGNAEKMAYRRDLNKAVIDVLTERKAVAEALGYYFNKQGQIVYDSKTIGFHLDELKKNVHPIAVAGGESKALAVLSVRHFIQNGSIVLDEGCARKVLMLSKELNL